MIITKKPSREPSHVLPFRWFRRARDAFHHVLLHESPRKATVLLPAYIGWGPVEGSGVFDPVASSGRPYRFYRLNRRLLIDAAALLREIERHPRSIVVLIHYFGFKDPGLPRVKRAARTHGCTIVEDFAHGLFTFFRDPVPDFDHAFFALHKMLPYPGRSGGLLLSPGHPGGGREYCAFHRFNLENITRRRCANHGAALARIRKRAPEGLTVLRPELGGNVPESFPILLKDRRTRDAVHARMNEEGFGLISLYHELVNAVDASHRSERWVSDRITNLPIHQDAAEQDVQRMVDVLCRILPEAG